jgi:hypothetical protein
MPDAANIKSLTSMRFFAAFWVVMFHYWTNLARRLHAGGRHQGLSGRRGLLHPVGFHPLPRLSAGLRPRDVPLWRLPVESLARVYPLHLATLLGVGLMAFGGQPRGDHGRPQHRLLGSAAGQYPAAARLGPGAGLGLEPCLVVDLGRVVRLSDLPGLRLRRLALRARPILAVALALGLIADPLSRLRGAGRLLADRGHHQVGRAAHRAVLRLWLRPARPVAFGRDHRPLRRAGRCRGGPRGARYGAASAPMIRSSWRPWAG